MTAGELIEILERCEPTNKVRIFIDWDNRPEVLSVADNENHVLLGNELPAEVYQKDYKYER